MALTHSSVIVTTTVVDTRTRDQLSFVFSPRPQAMTIYLRFVELGSLLKGTNQKLLFLGNATTFLQLISNGSNYLGQWNNGISSTTATGTVAAPAFGDRVEHVLQLSATGTITLLQSINEAAFTTSTTSGSRQLPVQWLATTLWVNSFSTGNVGLNAFRNIEIVAGVKTLQEMRVRAGTD